MKASAGVKAKIPRSALVLVLTFATGALSQEAGYGFRVTESTSSLCEQLARTLSKKSFLNPPHCDRLLWDKRPPFQTLQRSPLTNDDIRRIGPGLHRFLSGLRPHAYATKAEDFTEELLKDQTSAVKAGYPFRYVFRFRPRIDIDNDGRPDDVIISKGSFPCGGLSSASPDPSLGPTDLLLLGRDGTVDELRSQQLYESLKELKRPQPESRTALVSTRNDPWGSRFGVFRYKGVYYFDTFALPDAEKPLELEPTAGIYGVFRRTRETTERVCKMTVRPVVGGQQPGNMGVASPNPSLERP